MTSENPWLHAGRAREQVALPEPVETTPDAPDLPPAAALAPVSSLTPPTSGGLPIEPVTTASRLWIVGAHGGAGEGTLAQLDDQWCGTGGVWPRRPAGDRSPVLLVARTHLVGLRAAQAALRQWASGSVDLGDDLLGLVLIPDAPGKLPRPLRDSLEVITGGAPRTWLLEWVDEWRYSSPDPARLPRKTSRLVRDLTALTPPSPAPVEH